MKRLVRDLIHRKGLRAFSHVSPEASVLEALKQLERSNCSAVLVTEGNLLRGIFSEKDFARASINKGVRLGDKVATVMTSRVYYVEPDFTLEDCLHVMSRVHVRHLPVIDGGQPIALISMRHIMEFLVEDKESQIRELTTYIMGGQIVESDHAQKTKHVPIYYTTQNQEVI